MLNTLKRRNFCYRYLLPKLPKRPFSTTSVRKSDPSLITIIGASTSWDPLLVLSNPMGITLIVLVSMATTLFYITQPMPNIYMEIPFLDFVEIVQLLSSIYHTYIDLVSHTMAFILNNINMFGREELINLYLILQEIINIEERIYSLLEHWIDILREDSMESDILIDISQDFRFEGNRIMNLIRNVEDILNIPHSERMPLSNAFEV